MQIYGEDWACQALTLTARLLRAFKQETSYPLLQAAIFHKPNTLNPGSAYPKPLSLKPTHTLDS